MIDKHRAYEAYLGAAALIGGRGATNALVRLRGSVFCTSHPAFGESCSHNAVAVSRPDRLRYIKGETRQQVLHEPQSHSSMA